MTSVTPYTLGRWSVQLCEVEAAWWISRTSEDPGDLDQSKATRFQLPRSSMELQLHFQSPSMLPCEKELEWTEKKSEP